MSIEVDSSGVSLALYHVFEALVSAARALGNPPDDTVGDCKDTRSRSNRVAIGSSPDSDQEIFAAAKIASVRTPPMINNPCGFPLSLPIRPAGQEIPYGAGELDNI
jgi:hypothetical protein